MFTFSDAYEGEQIVGLEFELRAAEAPNLSQRCALPGITVDETSPLWVCA